jgi:hypothetical protein
MLYGTAFQPPRFSSLVADWPRPLPFEVCTGAKGHSPAECFRKSSLNVFGDIFWRRLVVASTQQRVAAVNPSGQGLVHAYDVRRDHKVRDQNFFRLRQRLWTCVAGERLYLGVADEQVFSGILGVCCDSGDGAADYEEGGC